jgi:hypothetical protein
MRNLPRWGFERLRVSLNSGAPNRPPFGRCRARTKPSIAAKQKGSGMVSANRWRESGPDAECQCAISFHTYGCQDGPVDAAEA